MPDTQKVRKEDEKNKKHVGPETYAPINPNHVKSAYYHNVQSIGKSLRPEIV